MPGFKVSNDYAKVAPKYSGTPKAVWAAIAVSFAARIAERDPFGDSDAIAICIGEEWEALYRNGIVPQKPHGI